jgi:hypothetical protein
MPGTFYMALSAAGLTGAGIAPDTNKSATTTLVLTDGLNYSIDDENGWAPVVAMSSDQTRVIETITVDILGKTVEGGADDPYRVRRNRDRLVLMLRQIARGLRGLSGDGGEGGPVTLTVRTPNSNPAMTVSALLLTWDPATFLPASYTSAVSLATNTVEQVVIVVERRAPWVFSAYTYPNLLPGSAWQSNPGWSSGTYTSAYGADILLPYGGSGYLSIPASTTTTAPAGTTFDIVNGTTYTIVFTASMTTAAAQLNLILRNSASGADVSTSSGLITITDVGAITDVGRRYEATVTATATSSNVRLRITTFAGGTFHIGEILIIAGDIDDEVWHVTDAEHTTIASTAAAPPTTNTVTWPTSVSAKSPVDIVVSPYANNSATLAGEGVLLWTSGLTYRQSLPMVALAAPFTAVAGTNAPNGGISGAGFVLAYTPTVTTQVEMPVDILHNLTHYQVWAKVRNTSATTSFLVQMSARSSLTTASPYRVWGDKVLIGPQTTTTDPYVILLGTMQHSERLDTLELWVEATAASGVLHMTELDLIEQTEASGAIKHALTNTLGLNTLPVGIRATSNWLGGYETVRRGPYPTLEAANANDLAGVPAPTSDLPLVTTRGDTLRVVWKSVSGASWVQTSSAPATVTVSITATRLPAHDTPY